MLRALFEKTDNAVYISHLDLMRLFQRSFKRAGLPLTHTKGFNPRPSVSIALPLSLGVASRCELLDFDLEENLYTCEEIRDRLNASLTEGVKVLAVYTEMSKLKNLAYLACSIVMEYDQEIPPDAQERILALFEQTEILVEKKSKNGVIQKNIAPMIRKLSVERITSQELELNALICCQNPSLNPAQLTAAIANYLPDLQPDFVRICREEIYNNNNEIFR